MTLTLSHGPLGTDPTPTRNYDVDGPKHRILFEAFPRRIRATIAGETILDSTRAQLLHESNILPRLYVPEEDVRMDLLEATGKSSHCPFKGDASYWSIRVGDRVEEDSVWGYREPKEEASWLAGYVSFYSEKLDEWFDEDEEIFGHVRDPYHRVDARVSSRRVVVRAGGEVVAETSRPVLVSETGLPNRLYLRREDVRVELGASETTAHCPYKGDATYWTVRLPDGREIADAGWSYEQPYESVLKAAGHVCLLHDDLSFEET